MKINLINGKEFQKLLHNNCKRKRYFVDIPIEVIVDYSRITNKQELETIEYKLENYEEILQEICTVVEQGLLENFETEGNGTWQSVSPETEREKIEKGYGAEIEMRTGRLKSALTNHDDPAHIVEIFDNTLTIGVSSSIIPYFDAQNSGDPSRNVPARQMMQVNEDTISKIIEMVKDWFGNLEAISVIAV